VDLGKTMYVVPYLMAHVDNQRWAVNRHRLKVVRRGRAGNSWPDAAP